MRLRACAYDAHAVRQSPSPNCRLWTPFSDVLTWQGGGIHRRRYVDVGHRLGEGGQHLHGPADGAGGSRFGHAEKFTKFTSSRPTLLIKLLRTSWQQMEPADIGSAELCAD